MIFLGDHEPTITTDTAVILTTRPDGVYVWQNGTAIGKLPATACLNLIRQILNTVDLKT